MPSFWTIEGVIMQILGAHKYITSYSICTGCCIYNCDISPCNPQQDSNNNDSLYLLIHCLPILILNRRGDKSKLHLSKSLTCLSLVSFISFSLHICLCVLVGVWEHIRISSTGIQDQPSPSKILSNATIFVQSALACAPCCTANIAYGRKCPHFPKTTSSA